MRNEYIIDIVEKILFWNDVLINRKELFKDIVYNTTIVLIVGNSNYEELSKINFK